MDKHEEWIQSLAKNTPSPPKEVEKIDEKPSINKWVWMILIGLFVLAIVPRIWFIFKVSNPENPGVAWFGDAYHHWQIAYLSREIGFKEGFLRLWDLKGMEFFWGLLHPLLTILAFTVTGSINIGVERSLTAIMGGISVALIYLVVSKYWNKPAAIGASILAALNPVGVFNDGSGMVEPIGIPFLLLGIYLWPRKPFWAGFALFFALLARAEYWVFSIGIMIIMIIIDKVGSSKKAALAVGLLVPLFIYMKYLLDYTGNPIYPFYWNYVANIFGAWQFKTEFTAADIAIKHLYQFILLVSAIFSGLVLWKKPKGTLVYLLGLGNWIFLGASFGIGAYIGSYESYVWFVRFMILPYMFIGIMLSVLLFYYLPKIKYIKFFDKIKLNWLVLLAVLILVQPVWIPIMKKYNSTEPIWLHALELSEDMIKHYRGGKIVFFEANPELTYILVTRYGLEGKNIVSEMFDPYFYFEDDPYNDWGNKRSVVFEWLKKFEIETIFTYSNSLRYARLAEEEPEYISKGELIKGGKYVVYQINREKIQEDF